MIKGCLGSAWGFIKSGRGVGVRALSIAPSSGGGKHMGGGWGESLGRVGEDVCLRERG